MQVWETIKKLASRVERFSLEKTRDILDLGIESNDSSVNFKVDKEGNPEFNYSKKRVISESSTDKK